MYASPTHRSRLLARACSHYARPRDAPARAEGLDAHHETRVSAPGHPRSILGEPKSLIWLVVPLVEHQSAPVPARPAPALDCLHEALCCPTAAACLRGRGGFAYPSPLMPLQRPLRASWPPRGPLPPPRFAFGPVSAGVPPMLTPLPIFFPPWPCTSCPLASERCAPFSQSGNLALNFF